MLNSNSQQRSLQKHYILKTDNVFFFLYFTVPTALLVNEHYSEIQFRFDLYD